MSIDRIDSLILFTEGETFECRRQGQTFKKGEFVRFRIFKNDFEMEKKFHEGRIYLENDTFESDEIKDTDTILPSKALIEIEQEITRSATEAYDAIKHNFAAEESAAYKANTELKDFITTEEEKLRKKFKDENAQGYSPEYKQALKDLKLQPEYTSLQRAVSASENALKAKAKPYQAIIDRYNYISNASNRQNAIDQAVTQAVADKLKSWKWDDQDL
ncbi:hypothetical protein TU86_12555 [Pseudomonas weihenstephanensis]|uniref:Uncharacterized protein n=1 Tax=Pseudomonas weihenstephanensis TaxID=1608994 RepID=A0A0J6INP6_9PSED|nr:hypothetical protein [Pseudomonas weihenstephanensis]KMN13729.1 hypothetical protein TU86_12555 [Pseudomonas weihenstephanensis]